MKLSTFSSSSESRSSPVLRFLPLDHAALLRRPERFLRSLLLLTLVGLAVLLFAELTLLLLPSCNVDPLPGRLPSSAAAPRVPALLPRPPLRLPRAPPVAVVALE
jgi:hypothetical protein